MKKRIFTVKRKQDDYIACIGEYSKNSFMCKKCPICLSCIMEKNFILQLEESITNSVLGEYSQTIN